MSRPWTATEDEVMRANWPAHGSRWLMWPRLLPGRTAAAITNRAHRLGLVLSADRRSTDWVEGEDDALRELYPVHGRHWPGWAVELPGRTPNAIALRANGLGVRGPTKTAQRISRKSDWTTSERRRLLLVLDAAAADLGRDAADVVREAARLARIAGTEV